MRIALNIVGVLLLLVGCVWILQGVSVLPGSFMSGQSKWAINGAICALLGLILLSPELLAAWTRNGRSDGSVLGMTIPVPDSLIQITFFLGALTFMYISARTVSDAEYRMRFFDPLIDDVQLTLRARDRYLRGIECVVGHHDVDLWNAGTAPGGEHPGRN